MNILTITDLHLGKKDKTEKLIYNLVSFLNENRKIAKDIDMIVVDGDIFHQLLQTNSVAYIQIVSFMTYLVAYCSEYDIVLRTLEGTPSHDNKQMIALAASIKGLTDKVDYRHMDTLEIEYMEKFDKHFMYLPDKFRDKAEEIQEEITLLLKEKGLAKVDCIFAHGYFNYQLPVPSKLGLSEEFFLAITRYYIVIGHVHNRSIWMRIIAPGSFDRLEVNQEGEKGGLYIKLGKTIEDSEYYFIENKHAMRSDTLDLRKLSIKNAYRTIKTHTSIHGFCSTDHLRLRTIDVADFRELLTRLKNDDVQFTIAKFTEKTIVNKTVVEIKASAIEITESNIIKLLKERPVIGKLSDAQLITMQNMITTCSLDSR